MINSNTRLGDRLIHKLKVARIHEGKTVFDIEKIQVRFLCACMNYAMVQRDNCHPYVCELQDLEYEIVAMSKRI